MEDSIKTERLQKVEFAVYGLHGKGGLVQEVNDIKSDMRGFREEIKKITDLQTKQVGALIVIGVFLAPFLEALFVRILHTG